MKYIGQLYKKINNIISVVINVVKKKNRGLGDGVCVAILVIRKERSDICVQT